MAKQNIKSNTKAAPIKESSGSSLWDTLNTWCEKRNKGLFYFTLAITLLFSILHFNARISEGNDDSLYVEAGYNYANDFFNYYYTSNAPFYPMFLGIIISVFGLKLIVLKISSVICNFFFVYFLYKAFKNRVQPIILSFVLLFVAVNHHFQYHASQTYTEAFFLCLQSIYLVVLFKLFDMLSNKESFTTKQINIQWLLYGFILFVMTMSRNVSAVLVPLIVGFFVLRKEWKNAIYSAVAFLIFKIPFEILKSIIWKAKSQYELQGKLFFQKDPYDITKGYEDFGGFVTRFFDNCNMYLSRRILQILGFASDNMDRNSGMLAFIVAVLFFVGFIIVLKNKNTFLSYSGFHLFAMVFTTFIVLQQRWDQPRLIMVHLPIMLIIVFYGLHSMMKKSAVGKNFLAAFLIIIFLSSFISSTTRISKNLDNLSHNLKGDIYYGYTPDWANFLKMSAWCADNLPDSSFVASRKAPMSFVYGKGMAFYPVYKVFALDTATKYSNPDSVLAVFKRKKVTHVILGSLRRDPSKNDGDIINTVHRVIQPVAQKYPQKIRLVHQIPEADKPQVEPTYLYEIKY